MPLYSSEKFIRTKRSVLNEARALLPSKTPKQTINCIISNKGGASRTITIAIPRNSGQIRDVSKRMTVDTARATRLEALLKLITVKLIK